MARLRSNNSLKKVASFALCNKKNQCCSLLSCFLSLSVLITIALQVNSSLPSHYQQKKKTKNKKINVKAKIQTTQ